MLVPLQQEIVSTVTTTLKSTVLESGFAVKPILHATLYLRNASSTISIRALLKAVLDFGTINVNPLFSGVYTNTLLDTVIAPGGMLVHRFDASVLLGDLLKHELHLVTSSGSAKLAGLLIGQYEDVGSYPLPTANIVI